MHECPARTILPFFRRFALIATIALAGCRGAEASTAGVVGPLVPKPPAPAPRPLADPGRAPWVAVPASEVLATCGLDPALLAEADRRIAQPWAIVRHGRLCHSSQTENERASEAFSTTKTLGALVAGVVAYETRALARTGPKTGAFRDDDRVDHWVDAFRTRDARVAHVLAMVAGGPSVERGRREMVYDIFGEGS